MLMPGAPGAVLVRCHGVATMINARIVVWHTSEADTAMSPGSAGNGKSRVTRRPLVERPPGKGSFLFFCFCFLFRLGFC